jgi:hypothetical protein
MWSTDCPISFSSGSSSNSDYLREHARRLLRSARSGHASVAFPVLRRVIAASAFSRATRLGDLHALRGELQLKHLLAVLAFELGYSGWDVCAQEVDLQPAACVDRYRLDAGAFNDFEMNWFGDFELALEWQGVNGGYVVRYGRQGVAILKR